METRPSLLCRVRDGRDVEAWNAFVAVYGPLVYRYARQKGLQDADAADLTQDVMAAVARAMRSFEYRPERGRFRDWLRTACRRELARFLQTRSRRPDGPPDGSELERAQDEEDGRPDGWAEAFNARVLGVALDRIRPCFEPTTWRAFERVWLEDRSAAETAGELAVRIDRVYLAKSRVLKRLEAEVHAIADGFSWLDLLERS